jgi:hypothetical protein
MRARSASSAARPTNEVDATGNRYITGSFQNLATFGTGSSAVRITSRGQDDIFVAKYDAAGALIWARQAGGSLADQGRGIAVAGDGSVYVTGRFATLASFVGSSVRLSAEGASDSFVARYDRDGTLLWAFRAGGTVTDNGLAIAVDSGSNALVTGNFAGLATFADLDAPAAATLISAGGGDGFLVKYDPQGQLIWARQASGSGNDSGHGIAVDSGGDVYVTGAFGAVATFATPASTISLTSAGLDDVFVARYSAAGELRWATRAGGSRADRALAIGLDGSRNSYITGFFTDEASFGGRTLAGSGTEILLAKLDPNGAFLQAVSAGGPRADEGRGIAIAPDRTIYLTGTFRDTALFGAGDRLRELRQRHRSVASDNSIFIAAYTPDFALNFIEAIGAEANGSEQSGNAIAADTAGRAHLTGIINTDAVFGIGSGIIALQSLGKSDIFLASYATGTPREVFYFSSSTGGSVDGIGFADEDVLAYDPANNTWSVLIDGSDIGLADADIDAFEWRSDGSQFMSFETPVTLPGIPFAVDDSDIVRFIPDRLGAITSGRFEFFFDGSDVGLETDAEDVDAIGFRADGKLVVSTLGAARVPGARSEVAAASADLLLFSGERFGEATRGSWEHFFVGALSGLGDDLGEGLSALWFKPNGEFVFGTGGTVNFTKFNFNSDATDIFSCTLETSSNGLRCFANFFLDSSSKGLRGEVIDAFSVGDSGVLGDIGDGNDTEPGPPEDPLAAPGKPRAIFVPLVSR